MNSSVSKPWYKRPSWLVVFLLWLFFGPGESALGWTERIMSWIYGSQKEQWTKMLTDLRSSWSEVPVIGNDLIQRIATIGGFLFFGGIIALWIWDKRHEKPQAEPSNRVGGHKIGTGPDETKLLTLCKKQLRDVSKDLRLINEMHNAQRAHLLKSIRRAERSILLITGHHEQREFSRCYGKYGAIDDESVALPKLSQCANECADFLEELATRLRRRMLDKGVKDRAIEVGVEFAFPLPPEEPGEENEPSLRFRPIPRESMAGMVKGDVIAKLAVKNCSGKLLKGCTARLLDAFLLMNGNVLSAPQFRPSVNSQRGESFYLRWSASEPATQGGMFLDIPASETEHFADILIVDREHPGTARFCAVERPQGPDAISSVRDNEWWKLRICVSSESGASELIELVAACSDRDPGPISLDLWSSRGEKILEHQRKAKD